MTLTSTTELFDVFGHTMAGSDGGIIYFHPHCIQIQDIDRPVSQMAVEQIRVPTTNSIWGIRRPIEIQLRIIE